MPDVATLPLVYCPKCHADVDCRDQSPDCAGEARGYYTDPEHCVHLCAVHDAGRVAYAKLMEVTDDRRRG